jgi:hypothetical protein
VIGGLLAVLGRTGAAFAGSAPWTALTPLTPSDSMLSYGNFALDGDYVLANPYRLGQPSFMSWGVDVLQRSGGGFDRQATIAPPDTLNRGFGQELALSGNTALLAAAETSTPPDPPIPGSVFVYVRNGSSWTLQQELKAPDGQADAGWGVGGDAFGSGVVVQGDTALVGAPRRAMGADLRRGGIYFFARTGTTWSMQQEITPPDGVDAFGLRIALDGDTFVTGVPGRNGPNGSPPADSPCGSPTVVCNDDGAPTSASAGQSAGCGCRVATTLAPRSGVFAVLLVLGVLASSRRFIRTSRRRSARGLVAAALPTAASIRLRITGSGHYEE